MASEGATPALPNGPYDVVVADPPWRFAGWGVGGDGNPKGRGYSRHYETMRTEDIASLPVVQMAADNAVLLLWAIGTRIPDAIGVMRAWGFRYVTMPFVWVKTGTAGQPVMGTGYWTRGNAELVLLGTRGRGIKPQSTSTHSVILAPRREHSRKPDEMYDRVGAMFPGASKVDLFAREARPGWDTWGNEANRFGERAK